MKHKLHIAGKEVDLSFPAVDILAAIQSALNPCYPNSLVLATDYTELDERTCEVRFQRSLPFDYYGALSGCLGYIDASIISGFPESEFVFDPVSGKTPITGPLLPWGKCWYVPMGAFTSLYRHLNETMTGEKISRVRITATTSEIVIQVKFARDKGKYDDDIADLENELGGPLEDHRGETLTYRLKELADICERTYPKTKSYRGLRNYLKKTYDIELEIK